MELTKINRDDNVFYVILWPFSAWSDWPGLKVYVERSNFWKLSLSTMLTEDRGIGVSFSLLGLYFCFELMNVIPRGVYQAMGKWARKRAAYLSNLWMRKVYAYEVDPREREVFYVCLLMSDPDVGAGITVSVWSNLEGWDHDRWPWNGRGWTRSIYFMNAIFGWLDCVKEVEHDNMPMSLLMPEGGYDVTVRTYTQVFKRPRLPFKWTYHRATVECEAGVPIPGKGTTGYNCDDDVIYSLTFAGRKQRWYAEEALIRFREEVMLRRVRYGGVDWLSMKGTADLEEG